MTDASGTTENDYDELGRTIKTTKLIDSTSYIAETTYDALDRTKTLTYPDGTIIKYFYDNTYTYWDNGNVKSITDKVDSNCKCSKRLLTH